MNLEGSSVTQSSVIRLVREDLYCEHEVEVYMYSDRRSTETSATQQHSQVLQMLYMLIQRIVLKYIKPHSGSPARYKSFLCNFPPFTVGVFQMKET